MSYLLDTNIVSESRRPKADAKVLKWLASVSYYDLHLSVLVLGEIRRGIEALRRRDPKQAATFQAFIEALARDYADRIVPIDGDVAEEWGRIAAKRTISTLDGLMAATALVRDWTFVTRNTKDVESTGVKLLNPFD